MWRCLAIIMAIIIEVMGLAGAIMNHTDAALADQVSTLPGIKTTNNTADSDSALGFNMFSGYFEITSTNMLFYALVEAQTSPETAPLIIWMNAGPGCSGMVSFLTEFGPFKLISPENDHPSQDDLATLLEENPYSWNRLANVLYIEQPIGVGYSHTTRNIHLPQYSDRLSKVDNMLAVEAFFERFPCMNKLDIFLASESYGGHFAIHLLDEIHSFAEKYPSDKSIALEQRVKGVVVGNPFVDFNTGVVARAEALWGLQLVPAFEWRAFRDAGCHLIQTYSEFLASKASCQAIFDRLMASVGSHIDLYNINYDVCKKQSTSSSSAAGVTKRDLYELKHFFQMASASNPGTAASTGTTQFARTLDSLSRRLRGSYAADSATSAPPGAVRDFAAKDDDDDDDGINDDFDDDEYQDDDAGIINVDKEGGYESCSYHYMTAYLNRPEVKAALHVPQDITWIDCNEDVQSTWPLEDFYGSSLSSFEAAIHRNHAISSANNSANATADSSTGQQVVKLLVYSGDNDIICPTVGTQRWVFELPHETTSLWRPWYFTEKNKASGVGGYVTQFNSSFTLVTLHEGGHMVAAYQPRQAYDMMKTFLNTEDFFTPPDEVKVLKLYYSLTLQEWRIIDKHSSGLEDQGNEQAAEQGSDVGYEFVRDAIRHCLFDNANITISGKLVDVFGVKVHHAYEVDMDATLGVDVGAAPGVPMDDDFLFARQSAQAEASRKLYSYDKEAEDGSSWNGLWYDKREVVVIAVEVVVATFDHLYDLKTELDVAFETSLYTGHLEKTMRKALHARHEMHDRQGSADDALPYSDIVNVVLERRLGESKEWYSADILPSAHKQDFDWDEYIRVWEFGESFEDDDMSGESFRKELELIEYSMINVGIALITFTVTFLVVAGTFYSYRTYHDRLLHRMGYEIQDDFDDMSNYGDSDSGSDDNDDGDGVGGGVEMSDQAGEVVVRGGTGTSTTTLASTSAFVLEVEHDDGTTSALTI